MADEAVSRSLRRARDQFLSSRDIPNSVRADIAASWRRSALHGLAPDRLAAPYDGELVDLTGRFAVSARPVAERLGDDLAGTGVTLLLADEQARLIDRRVSDAGLRARLDNSLVAPGFRHGEQHVGTNAIGTCLQQRSPAVVTGTEHFAETYTTLACAAAPVTDARSGQTVGAVGLTCPAEIANTLMLPFVKRAAFAIEQRLVAGSATADHALLRRFLHARRRAKGPLVSVNQHVMHANTAAARIVNPADQEICGPGPAMRWRARRRQKARSTWPAACRSSLVRGRSMTPTSSSEHLCGWNRKSRRCPGPSARLASPARQSARHRRGPASLTLSAAWRRSSPKAPPTVKPPPGSSSRPTRSITTFARSSGSSPSAHGWN